MPKPLGRRVASGWTALWSGADECDLPKAMKQGKRIGHAWFRPAAPVTFRPTGPVVLLNQDPWGAVDIDLHDNEISQLESMSGHDFTYDEATGTFTAKVRFGELKYAGNYTLRRGSASGSAFKNAMSFLSVGAPEDDQNIALAKDYQGQLSGSDSGRFMLSTYYAHNDAYAKIYENSIFLDAWQTQETNGKTTAAYAQQTSASAQNPTGTPVNQDPGYNPHALSMQILTVATCKAQKNQDAAAAAAAFKKNTDPQMKVQQNVSSVMGVVNKTTPPPTSAIKNISMLVADNRAESPEYVAMRDSLSDVIARIEKEEDDVRSGILLRERTGRPIDGAFRATFDTADLTLTGTVTEGDGGPTVEFTKLSGPPPEVRVRLGAFPGELHAVVESAIERANFLKGVLGQRVLAALNDPQFLGYLARMMTFAMRRDDASNA
jgi:hypothetical protein